jgi:hypothetical protein
VVAGGGGGGVDRVGCNISFYLTTGPVLGSFLLPPLSLSFLSLSLLLPLSPRHSRSTYIHTFGGRIWGGRPRQEPRRDVSCLLPDTALIPPLYRRNEKKIGKLGEV